MIHVIGLHGAAGSGKSTVARFLVKHFGCVPVALADYFKIPAVALDGLPLEEVFGPKAKSEHTRRYLQQRGTEQGRNVHGVDVWVNHLRAHLYRLSQMGVERVVVDDVRFPNEAEALRMVEIIHGPGFAMLRDTWRNHPAHGLLGEVWQITGRGGLSGATAQHVSELPLDAKHVDWSCDNSHSESEMRTLVQSYLAIKHGWTLGALDELS